MANLKKEVLCILEQNGKTIDDIIWIGCEQFRMDVKTFWNLADTEYDDGYGAPEVATDLLIVGKDFWLERADYDGSEWFEFKVMPKMPGRIEPITALTVDQHNGQYGDNMVGWRTLGQMNEVPEWDSN